MSQPSDFWSRRRAAVAAEKAAEEAAEQKRLATEAEAALAEKTDGEILDELGLSDPDELKPGDDFAAFMSRAVPDRLRRRALRQLWLSNPTLANVDGLLEYGEDYTDSATVLGAVTSLYEAGKGMPDAQSETEPAVPAGPEGQTGEAEVADAAPQDTAPQSDPAEDEAARFAEDDAPEDVAEDDLPAAARRMRFRFET